MMKFKMSAHVILQDLKDTQIDEGEQTYSLGSSGISGWQIKRLEIGVCYIDK